MIAVFAASLRHDCAQMRSFALRPSWNFPQRVPSGQSGHGSRSEALATIAAADVEATELVEAHEKLSVVDETLDGFCFYGYADYTVCPDLLRWMRCAMSCDARIPRGGRSRLR